jgi:hypothetical protein
LSSTVSTAPTIIGFCQRKGMSKTKFYELQKLNLAPRVTQTPGTSLLSILPEDEAEWEAMRKKANEDGAFALERARRKAQAEIAAKASIKSDNRVSKRKGKTRRRRKR